MTKSFTVTQELTAQVIGSGSLPVLATPALAAWIENVATLTAAPLLSEGETSVGTNINLDHLRKSLIGETIDVSVELLSHEGRQLCFSAECHNAEGTLVGKAFHTRFIVNTTRFMSH
ncbi:MAG: thioesterase family protein [Paludibacteraceae bacterium]|nr:thioesterase family protein [Paludibacteraceae bacterium]